jgi:hypothetical protein
MTLATALNHGTVEAIGLQGEQQTMPVEAMLSSVQRCDVHDHVLSAILFQQSYLVGRVSLTAVMIQGGRPSPLTTELEELEFEVKFHRAVGSITMGRGCPSRPSPP